MKAALLKQIGGPEGFDFCEVSRPTSQAGEVLIEVCATALNRADLLQRRGTYGTPTQPPAVLGLECAGIVREVGASVQGWAVGDRVCALVKQGAYAQYVAAPAAQVLPVPDGMSLAEAAALPEAACTVWSNLFDTARLSESEVLLVHGGAGGVGSLAIQAGRALGARVLATAGTPQKLVQCMALGAVRAISYRDEDFVQVVKAATAGRGADVILDNMGAAYLERNVDALAHDGRIAMIGLQSGREATVSLGKMMGKRCGLFTTSLSDRPAAAKARIVAGVRRDLWPHVEAGHLRPLLDRSFHLERMAEAHAYMEQGLHAGKIVVHVCAEQDLSATKESS